MFENLYKLKNDFVEHWTIERLQALSIDEYTNLELTSLCYWLESKTEDIGSIWGGSAYKFGVYRRNPDNDKVDSRTGYATDGTYSWVNKFGDTAENAFQNIKSKIIAVVELALQNSLENIDRIDLAPTLKWKLAFLYGDFNLINIFKPESLVFVAKKKGLTKANQNKLAECHKFLIGLKAKERDYFEYAKSLWAIWVNKNDPESTTPLLIKLMPGQSLYKISHGAFKNGGSADIIEEFKQRRWIVIHQDTGKNQAEVFRNTLKRGDYVYITIGGDSLYAIAKITEEAWSEVHEDIVGEPGWIFREVEYIRYATDSSTTDLKPFKEFIYPSGNSTLQEISEGSMGQANERIFVPHFNTTFEIGSITNNEDMSIEIKSLNTILFGPPGTGKTFNSVDAALKLVAPDAYNNAKGNRDLIVIEFNKLLVKATNSQEWETETGQIAFCTFHQSFSYEDFVEGIKPKTNGKGDIAYHLEDGIFKLMSQLADKKTTVNPNAASINEQITSSQAKYFRFKIDESQFENFINNKNIEYPNTELTRSSTFKGAFENAKHDTNDSIILLNKENSNLVAIGKVVGAIANNSESNTVSRKVDWFYHHLSIPFDKIYNETLQNSLGESLSRTKINMEEFKILLSEQTTLTPKNYVIIVDEINRGNVSQIFGELITLIEHDKRKGTDNELSVILPYSKKPFSVPANLFLVGTMNTADRSVEALDTALRRRFSFIEMPPIPEKLDNSTVSIDGVDFNLQDILNVINKRIEKLVNRDHLIGHSYFLEVINEKKTLKESFANSIVPLLQEYFYGDYAKMALVIGRGFVSPKEPENKTKDLFFADVKDAEHDAMEEFFDKKSWHLQNILKMSDKDFAGALNLLLNK